MSAKHVPSPTRCGNRSLTSTGREAGAASHPEMAPLRLQALGLDHAIPPKKPPRDEALRLADGRPSESYAISGLLKVCVGGGGGGAQPT